MSNVKSPKIRFKGFTDDWEQRKFGSLLNETRDKTTTEDQDTLLSCAIDGMYLNSELFSHFRGSSNIGYLKIKKNDLILSAQNLHLGNCNVNLRFDHGIISPAYKVFELVDCDPLFMQAWVKQDTTKNFFLKASTEGASVCRKNIVWEDLYKQELPIPNITEQEKIGAFFSHLDNLITLHQRKYEKLQNIKQAMLEKMFPKNGENFPKIRFKGFTDAWEQRKVGDYYEFKNGLNKGKEFFGKGTPIVNFTDVFHNRGLFPEMLNGKVQLEPSEIKNYEVKKGDIFFTRTSETIEEIGYSSVMLEEPKDTVFSGFVLRGRCFVHEDPLDNLFKKYVFTTKYFRSEMLKKSSITTRALTSGTAIKDMQFLYPSSKKEQYLIGMFLSSIDNLITLHQRKYEKLIKIKKSFLQKIFI